MKILLFSVFLFLITLRFSFCAANAPQSSSMEQQVAAVMEDAKKDDYNSNLAFRLETHREDTLPFLQKYVLNPDERVQIMVVLLVTGSKSAKAQELMIDEIGSSFSNVSDMAVSDIFYEPHGPVKLTQSNQQLLKTRLLEAIKSNYDSYKIILLLSRYSGDKEVISALQEQRKKHPTALVRFRGAPEIDLFTFYDIALTRLGDTDALVRLKDIIDEGKIDNLVAILGIGDLDTLDFVDDHAILSRLVESLHDKRETYIDNRVIAQTNSSLVMFQVASDDNQHNPFLHGVRVCDVALPALAKKAGTQIAGVPNLYVRHFNDDELNISYAVLKAYFANIPTSIIR